MRAANIHSWPHFRRDLCVSFLIYLAIAMIVTWPVAAQMSTTVAGTPGEDNFQFVWNLWWHVEALLNQQVNPANVTMLHWPEGGPNPLLGLSVVVPSLAIPTTLIFDPIVSYNLWFLLSFPLVGISGYLLTASITHNRYAAFIGGLVFGFFPHKTMQGAAHYLQIMLFLFPLYLMALLRLFRRPTLRQAIVTAIMLSVSLLVNLIHVGYFLLPLSVFFLSHYLWTERHKWREWGQMIRYVGMMLGITLVLTGPILLPFIVNRFTGQLNYFHQPGVVRFSADFLALWLPAPHHPLPSLSETLIGTPAWREISHFMVEPYPEENVAYLGYTVLFLAGLGVWRRWRLANRWLWVAVVMIILSLGPFLKVGGTVVAEGSGPIELDGLRSPVILPYAALMKLPFYEWGRIPNRQIMTAMLALAVLAGLGISAVQAKNARRLTIIATFLIVAEYLVGWPYPTASAERFYLPVWNEIQQEARGAVLDLPQWNFFAYPPSNNAMLAQTAHGQPIVGGYIHRLPPGSRELPRVIQEVVVPPAPLDIVPRPTGTQALATLRSLGIATVVLHKNVRGETWWWTESTWNDADHAAAEAILGEWAGAPRWENEELAVYDLPDVETSAPTPLWMLEGRDGWHAAESDGTIARRWLADEGKIGVWLPTARQTSLRIEMQAFAGPRTVTLQLNDTPLLTQSVNETIIIETPPLDLAAGYHSFTLSQAEACQRPVDIDPATGDQRCLGLLISGVSLNP